MPSGSLLVYPPNKLLKVLNLAKFQLDKFKDGISSVSSKQLINEITLVTFYLDKFNSFVDFVPDNKLSIFSKDIVFQSSIPIIFIEGTSISLLSDL